MRDGFAGLPEHLQPSSVPRQRAITTRTENKMLLIHIILGLNPGHDAVECVRVLYEEGREAFEKLRGPACEYSAEWRPLD